MGERRPLLLDLFCCAGGAGMGYHRAGFDVVGVDLERQRNYPFDFVQGDAMSPPFDLRTFDVIHASPPCQRYSVSTAVHGREGRDKHPDFVGPVREVLRASGRLWVIENVPGAPLEPPAIMLCGTMFGLRVLRHRWFESNVLLLAPAHSRHPRGMLTNSHRCYDRGESPFVCLAGHNFERREGERAIGINWMGSRRELTQSIPPAYTEFIGRQLINILARD